MKMILLVAALVASTTTAVAAPKPRPPVVVNQTIYVDHVPEYYRDYNDRYHNEYRPAGYRYVDVYEPYGPPPEQPQPRYADPDDTVIPVLGFIAGAIIGSQLDRGHNDGYHHRWHRR